MKGTKMDTQELKPVDDMTDRELLVELVSTVRALNAAATQLQNSGVMGMLGNVLGGKRR